jgi:hypothetical protein
VPVILANLLHAFAWRLPDGVTAEELSMEETSLELLITQFAITEKIVQCKTSCNDMLLITRRETWHALQNTPLLLQHSKRSFNDITKG